MSGPPPRAKTQPRVQLATVVERKRRRRRAHRAFDERGRFVERSAAFIEYVCLSITSMLWRAIASSSGPHYVSALATRVSSRLVESTTPWRRRRRRGRGLGASFALEARFDGASSDGGEEDTAFRLRAKRRASWRCRLGLRRSLGPTRVHRTPARSSSTRLCARSDARRARRARGSRSKISASGSSSRHQASHERRDGGASIDTPMGDAQPLQSTYREPFRDVQRLMIAYRALISP